MNADTDTLALQIAYGSYRGMTADIYRRARSLGIGAPQFFSAAESELAATGIFGPLRLDADSRQRALAQGAEEAAAVKMHGINATDCCDRRYPGRLMACPDAPAMIYTKGDTAPQTPYAVAIVGTRRPSQYGVDMCTRLVQDLGRQLDGLTVISGLAYGIDIAAHRAALANGISTGAVVAHGLNTLYPADHRNEARAMAGGAGFIMSEYRTCDTIHKGNFLARNRIIAGLADITIVVESDLHGGAVSTAHRAAAYGRITGAVPGRVTDAGGRGCNALIADKGAAMIRDAGDILRIMGWKAKAAEGVQQQLALLDAGQQAVVDYLRLHPESTANDMCAPLNISYSSLSATLIELEITGAVAARPGGRYSATDY